MTDDTVTPFRIDIPEQDLADLAARLDRTAAIPADAILANVTLYWLTGTGATSS